MSDMQQSTVRIGFWPDKNDKHEIQKIISALTDMSWKHQKQIEYNNVVKFFSGYDDKLSYKGDSYCRVCGQSNGSDEYTRTVRKIVFVYPSGFVHYIVQHGIKPDQLLIDFIMNRI